MKKFVDGKDKATEEMNNQLKLIKENEELLK